MTSVHSLEIQVSGIVQQTMTRTIRMCKILVRWNWLDSAGYSRHSAARTKTERRNRNLGNGGVSSSTSERLSSLGVGEWRCFEIWRVQRHDAIRLRLGFRWRSVSFEGNIKFLVKLSLCLIKHHALWLGQLYSPAALLPCGTVTWLRNGGVDAVENR
jgi:hypothetical protein